MTSSDNGNARPSGGALIAGIVLLLVAAVSSFLLVMYSWDAMELAGCGEDPEGGISACAALANSAFGKVPGLGWPVSHVGFAYFLGALLTWILTRGDLPGLVRWLVRFGGLISLMYIGVMLAKGTVCPYCLSAHIANLLFVGLVEFGFSRPEGASEPSMGRAVAPAAVVGVVALGALLLLDGRMQAKVDAVATEELEEELGAFDQPQVEPLPEQMEYYMPAGFTGRYPWGPEEAVARVVIVSGYQCPDCKKMNEQVRTIKERYDNVSIAEKHFPFCPDCNPRASRNLHPNACWAARAAEAAGMLQGSDGFWRMSTWLFDRKGSFTDAELNEALPGLGFERGEFLQAMSSQETLDRIAADSEEAVALGMFFTPMVFVNGVEIKNWRAPDSLIRAVDRVIASGVAPATAEKDQPLNAVGKFVSDWWRPRPRPDSSWPVDYSPWLMGDLTHPSPTDVTVWGDLQEPHTARLDKILRKVVPNTPGVRYTFRHYPFDSSCNGNMEPPPRHPNACAAARAAEAAGQLGGQDMYWMMHGAIMENQDQFTINGAADFAQELGMDRDAFIAMMGSPEVEAAIQEDIAGAKRLGLRGIPFVFFGKRAPPRWYREDNPELIPRLMIEISAGLREPPPLP